MKFTLFALIFCSFLLLNRAAAQEPDLVRYVNTLQGTDSEWALSYGSTYPTVGLPFGQHFYSAQTGKNGNGWKYQYKAKTIRGFQQVHQCSPWMNDYAVFSLMPNIQTLKVNEDDRALSFSHANETAKPHYYSVKFDNGTQAEISPVERGSHMRFSFPKSEKAFLVLDGFLKDCQVEILPKERKIIGWVNNGRFVPENFKSYFVLEFSQGFKSFGTWENVNGKVKEGNVSDSGKGVGAYLEFKPGTKVEVKIASSFISPGQAQLNFNNELAKNKKFEDTKSSAYKVWNTLLNRIAVEGDSEEDKATFYSCLFRANLFSRKFYDYNEDGRPYYYSPYD